MFRFLALGLVVPALILGCETAADTEASAEKPATVLVKVPQKDRYLVGFSQCTVVEPWRVQMNSDVRGAAQRHANLELLILVAEDDIDRQVNDVQNFVSRGADFIIISPKETAASLTAAVATAYRRGIPVIVLDRQLIGDEFTTFIGADNHKIGRAAGDFIRKTLDGEGHIVELKGNMATVPGQLRHKGFRDAIAAELGAGTIRIVHEADIDWKEDRARTEMDSALAANPVIHLVYGHNDPAAHGAYTAARQAGRAEGIKFVGIDALPHEGVAYVQEGVLDATLEYPTGGEEAIQLILDMIAGKEIPRNITLGTRLFTKDNVSSGGEAIE
jgi:ribose transport system substrate-binding protein